MDQNTPREDILAKPLKPARVALNVLALCFALSVMGRGLGESFTVFLKPISESFGWDRAQVVSVYSLTWFAGGLTAPLVAGFRGPAGQAAKPEVRIQSPAANSRHWSDAGVPFNVEASSPNGPIVRLDLFAVYREPPNWPTVPHYMTSWTYQVPWKENWNGLFPADYELVAVATDTSGVAEASEPPG